MLRLTLGAVLLTATAVPAAATTLRPPLIESGIVAVGDAVVFCQPDQTFTILDLTTGTPLVRDPNAACDGWLRLSEHGLMLSTHWGRHRMIDIAQSMARKTLVPRWEAGSSTMGCRSSRVFAEVIVCARSEDFVVEARSLSDGSVRWSYEAPGAVMDIVEREGRLLLQSGDYRLARHVSVLDFASGRLMFQEAVVQDASFQVSAFDGRQVVLEARPTPGSKCREHILRTLAPDPTGTRLLPSDSCGPAATSRGGDGSRTRDWEGPEASPRFQPDGGSGWWIEGRGPDGPWLSWTSDSPLRLVDVTTGPGVLFLERHDYDLVTLECLDVTTGHPRWLYVHGPARQRAGAWEYVKAGPPEGTMPADVKERPPDDAAQKLRSRLAGGRYPAPRILDPLPADQPAPRIRP